MDELRKGIDQVDSRIISLLAERFEIAAEIGKIKKNLDIDIVDSSREKALLDRLKQSAENSGLRAEFVNSLWDVILKESHFMQNNIIGDKNKKQ